MTHPAAGYPIHDNVPLEVSSARVSVLMVDDQPARLLTYETILENLGVNLVRAHSGVEALDRLLKEEFAVILLDVNMPGMDGFELARLVRRHPRLERTPIIFVTGAHLSSTDQLVGYEVGAIDYIHVPVVPEVLRSKVAVLVELHQRRRELREVNRQLAEARAQLETEHASVLARKEAQLRAVFEHPTELTVVLRAERDATRSITDWIYRDANANALALLGQSRDALIGRRLSDIIPDRAAAAADRCARALLTAVPERYEARVLEREFSVTIFSIGDDTVVSSGIDITDQKRVEAALRESERRYRALIEDAPVAVAHNTVNGRFEYANHTFCSLVGYTLEELRAKTWQEMTHPDDLPRDLLLG